MNATLTPASAYLRGQLSNKQYELAMERLNRLGTFELVELAGEMLTTKQQAALHRTWVEQNRQEIVDEFMKEESPDSWDRVGQALCQQRFAWEANQLLQMIEAGEIPIPASFIADDE